MRPIRGKSGIGPIFFRSLWGYKPVRFQKKSHGRAVLKNWGRAGLNKKNLLTSEKISNNMELIDLFYYPAKPLRKDGSS
ncbi:UNVERIFIED_ORG: hypothetical protein ABRZ91_002389 [Heyndrickxia coagulans]